MRAAGHGFASNPVGSGPFRVVRWIKDDRIELAANPDYFGGAPKVATVIFRPVPSESARAAALSSGEIDIVPLAAAALVERLGSPVGISVSQGRQQPRPLSRLRRHQSAC